MKPILRLLVILFLTTGSLSAQEKVYIPWFEVMGMHPDYQLSLTRLFRSYVESGERYTVVLPEVPENPVSLPGMEEIKALAQENGAAWFFTGELNRLSERVICTFSLYETATGNKVWSDLMRAAHPDDLDPILKRVAESMGTTQKASKVNDIYSVTDFDSRSLNQMRAQYLYGVSVGGAYPFLRDVESLFGAGFGVMASYDSRNLILDIKGEAYFSDVDFYFLSLDALYPLTDRNHTPFVLGGLGIGGMDVYFENEPIQGIYYNYDPHHSGGLLLFLGGGYIINRHSEVNLRLGARTFLPVFRVDGQYAPGVLFNATILFGRR